MCLSAYLSNKCSYLFLATFLFKLLCVGYAQIKSDFHAAGGKWGKQKLLWSGILSRDSTQGTRGDERSISKSTVNFNKQTKNRVTQGRERLTGQDIDVKSRH